MRTTTPRRQGFTLIELLVVIAIIAMLMAMLLPAIQRVRSSSDRTRCANNMNQIIKAIHTYHSDIGHLPWNGMSPQGPTTFYVQILPYVEEGPALQQILRGGTAPPVKVFVCPSRRNAEQAWCDYAGAASLPRFYSQTNVQNRSGYDGIRVSDFTYTLGRYSYVYTWTEQVIELRTALHSPVQIGQTNYMPVTLNTPDGDSFTIAFGEKSVDISQHKTFVATRDAWNVPGNFSPGRLGSWRKQTTDYIQVYTSPPYDNYQITAYNYTKGTYEQMTYAKWFPQYYKEYKYDSWVQIPPTAADLPYMMPNNVVRLPIYNIQQNFDTSYTYFMHDANAAQYASTYGGSNAGFGSSHRAAIISKPYGSSNLALLDGSVIQGSRYYMYASAWGTNDGAVVPNGVLHK
jgi:prepilin-type N-terminal cleavage/methylation domain-containing protein